MTVQINEAQNPLSDESLTNLEETLGCRLPTDYKAFLLQNNGGWPEPEGFDITWHEHQECRNYWRTSCVSRFLSVNAGQHADFLKYNRKTFRRRIPKETIAIAHDPGGNLILLGIAGAYTDKVLFWVKDFEVEEGEVPGYDNVGFLANSFDEFINQKLR